MLKALEFIGYTDGGSTPLFIRADDGKLYLTKLMGNRQGDCTLINEHVGSFVLRFMGVNVAFTTVLNVSEAFIVENNLRALPNGENFVAGPAFASQVVGDVRLLPDKRVHSANLVNLSPHHVPALINSDDFAATLIADMALDNVDVRQVVFEPVEGKLRALMVDQGCCFGGFPWVAREQVSTTEPGFRISVNSMVAASIFASCTDEDIDRHLARIEQLTPRLLQEAAAQAPCVWFDRTNLRAEFDLAIAAFFQRLPQIRRAAEATLEKIHQAGIVIYIGADTANKF